METVGSDGIFEYKSNSCVESDRAYNFAWQKSNYLVVSKITANGLELTKLYPFAYTLIFQVMVFVSSTCEKSFDLTL